MLCGFIQYPTGRVSRGGGGDWGGEGGAGGLGGLGTWVVTVRDTVGGASEREPDQREMTMK